MRLLCGGRATTSAKGRGCRAVPRDNPEYHTFRARGRVVWAPRVPAGLGRADWTTATHSCSETFRVPASREGLSRARPGALGARGAGGAGPRQCLYECISNRQKKQTDAVSPRSNRTVAPCNTQPRRKQLSRGTARQPRPLGELSRGTARQPRSLWSKKERARLSRGRATTSRQPPL